jgi:HTH-type transcriptional regulator/antitoxin HigA
MTTAMKYKVIKSKDQYDNYCDELEHLLSGNIDNALQDEIDLLTLLIEKYDEENNSFSDNDPVVLLRSFMTDHRLKAQDLSGILGISKGYVSDILNYKKGLSKDVIRKLADYFKVKQEAFNRHYELSPLKSSHLLNPNLSNATKQLRYVKH